MQVTLDKGRVHSVSIQGDFTGPYINVNISASAALELLQALDAQREEILDMANNYYDCSTCGETHHKSIKVCPALTENEE